MNRWIRREDLEYRLLGWLPVPRLINRSDRLWCSLRRRGVIRPRRRAAQ